MLVYGDPEEYWVYGTMWPPKSDVSWFRFAPVTIVISTIKHSESGAMFTNLANITCEEHHLGGITVERQTHA